MRNNGWEFNINGREIIKAGKFSWDFNVTFANNRNEILTMDETILEGLNGAGDTPDNGSQLSMVRLNNPLGAIYGYRYKGVYRYSEYNDALAAYNAGEGNVRRWLADQRYSGDGVTLNVVRYKETERYIERVIKLQKFYSAFGQTRYVCGCFE